MAIRGVESTISDTQYIAALERALHERDLRLEQVESKVSAISRAPRKVNDSPEVDIAGVALPDGGVNPARRFTPATPAGLNGTAVIFFDDGLPAVSISIGFERVTNAQAGDPITISRHELQGREVGSSTWRGLTSVGGQDTIVNFAPLPTGQVWEFRMRAVSNKGVSGLFSDPVLELTLPNDMVPPPKPSTPTVTSRLGTLSVTWDGRDSTGAVMPTDFLRNDVQISDDGIAGWATIGDIRLSGGAGVLVVTDLPYESTRYFRFVAVDNSGNMSEVSDTASGTVTPLVATDIIGEVIDGANIVDGTITASDKIIANTITGALIQALAINAGHIQSNAITADKILAGSITGIKIQANSVTTDKLTIGDFSNLLDDPNFTLNYPTPAWGLNDQGEGVWAINSVTGVAWNRELRFQASTTTTAVDIGGANANTVTCVPGDQFYAEVSKRTSNPGTSGLVGFYIRWRRADGSNAFSTNYDNGPNGTLSGVYTAPANAVSATFQLTVRAGFLNGNAVVFYNPMFKKMTTGQLIVNGSITSTELSATAIDGKTITGAVLRTAASGARVQIDSAGLRAFNSDGSVVTTISSSTGQVSALGTLRTGTAGQRVEISSTSAKFYNPGGFVSSISGFANGASGSGLGLSAGGNTLQIANVNLAPGGSAQLSFNAAAYFPDLYTGTGVVVPTVVMGKVSITGTPSGTGVTTAITFPSGSFTSAPIVTVTPGSARLGAGITTVSSSGFTFRVDNWSPGASATADAHWIAVS